MENNIEKIFLIMKNINKQHHIFQLGELEEEEKNINDLQDILKKLDVLLSCIDKKFISGYSIEELKDEKLYWIGSSNQRIIDVKNTLEKGEMVIYEDNKQAKLSSV